MTAVTVLGSVSGAPGVTTAVLALAMAWPPERSLLLVELAASGGDLATWLDLPPAPSSVTAATEGRRELSAATLWGHTLPLPGLGRVRVLAAPPGAEQAVAARRRLLDAGLDRALAGLTDTDVLVDVGRIAAGTAASDLPAGPLLVVARPQVSDVRHLLHRPAAAEPARLLLVGDVPYGPGEVADATRMPVGAVLPHDEGAAGALTGTADHSSSKSLYAHDPDGIEFEVAWFVPADKLDDGVLEARRGISRLDLAAEFERYGDGTVGGLAGVT